MGKVSCMKTKYLLFALFVLISGLVKAQGTFDQNSLEIQFGYSHPLNNFEDNSFGANFGLNNIRLGYRFMFNPNLGVRANYSFNRYITESAGKATSRMNSFNLELVYNLGRGLRLVNSPTKKVALLGYAGMGYTGHQNPDLDVTERILPVNFGLTPLISVNHNLALFFDVNTVVNIQQDLGYNGLYTDVEKLFEGNETGMHMNFSIGIMVYFGTFVAHADFL